MSRSGYADDDCDYQLANLYRGTVRRAFAGRRGQAFLKEMLAAMDAMPQKRLTAYDFEITAPGADEIVGDVCALGVVTKARGINMSDINVEDYENIGHIAGKRLNIAEAMAREIMYMNDEARWQKETPEDRFARMRKWVESNIKREAE